MLDNEEENPIANPSNPRPKEDWNLKWFTTLQDKVVELNHELRKHRHPKQYQLYLIAKIKEAFTYWHSDIAGWEKTHSELPLKKFLFLSFSEIISTDKGQSIASLGSVGLRPDSEFC